MNHSQLDRIQNMEQIQNEAAAAVTELLTGLDRYGAILPQLAALEEYYQSPLWLQDYDDDQAGRLPRDLRRGVLSQDAVHNLLADNDQLTQAVLSLGERLKNKASS